MSTAKSIGCNYDVGVGDHVLIYKHIEQDYLSCRKVDELPSYDEDVKLFRGPSCSTGNDTTYYLGCGTITRVFDAYDTNRTCWVRLAYSR
jgi:hypothetical protein